ncbi:MAG: germination protein, Ger(x)C family [Firmicutes bacterium]|nr:germination protein, Ger(x)C family [Bacillota bacterium]
MRFRVAVIIMLFVTSLLITGCNGAKELDDVAYVLTIGVDAAEGDQLIFTYEVAIPRALASESPGKANLKATVDFVTVTAPTLTEGRNLLNSVLARAPNLSHVTTFVIGEDLARKGLTGFLGMTMRLRTFRGATDIVVVNGKAKDFLMQNTPEEVLPSRWFQAILSTGDDTGYYLRTSLHEFYVRLKSHSGSPYATLMGINPLNGEGRSSGPAASNDNVQHDYLPKDIPRTGGNPATVVGTAVFKGDKMVGMLPSEETRILAMLLGNYPRGFMTITDPLAPQHSINVNLRLGRNPKIDVNISDEHAIISINVFLKGYLAGIPSGINYESAENNSILNQQISEMVRQKMLLMLQQTQELGADIVDFGYYLRPKYATAQEFENLHWDTLYPNAKFNVVVTTHIQLTGLMHKTAPIPSEKMQ